MRVDVKYIGDPKYIKTTYIHKERDRITVNVEMFLILNYSSIANTAIPGLVQEMFFVKANYRTLYSICLRYWVFVERDFWAAGLGVMRQNKRNREQVFFFVERDRFSIVFFIHKFLTLDPETSWI